MKWQEYLKAYWPYLLVIAVAGLIIIYNSGYKSGQRDMLLLSAKRAVTEGKIGSG